MEKQSKEINFFTSLLSIFSGSNLEIKSTVTPTRGRGGFIQCRILTQFPLASPFYYHFSLNSEGSQEILDVGNKTVTCKEIELIDFSPLIFEFNEKIFNERNQTLNSIAGLIMETINQILLDEVKPTNITFEIKGKNRYRYRVKELSLPKSRDEFVYELVVYFGCFYKVNTTHC